MKVLGISPLDKDSTVTLVEDGRILFAAGEERFTRDQAAGRLSVAGAAGGLRRDRRRRRPTSTASRTRSSPGRRRRRSSRAIWRTSVSSSTRARVRGALIARGARARPRRAPRAIPGLAEPNERMEKGFAKSLAYRMLASEASSHATSPSAAPSSGAATRARSTEVAGGARERPRGDSASRASSSASNTTRATRPTRTTPADSTTR